MESLIARWAQVTQDGGVAAWLPLSWSADEQALLNEDKSFK
jgi:hypothetical protein